MAREYFSLSFWADAGERALKTAAQAVAVAFTLSDSSFINLFDLNLTVVGQAALSGAVYSVITSIVSAPIGQSGTASMLPPPIGPEAPDPPAGG